VRLLSRIKTLARIRPLPVEDLPEVAGSVAIILDGNGRWAKRRGLPTAAGHRAGARTVRRIVEAAIDVGVHDLSVFAFSTENWSRPPDEVDALMEIFAETIERELPDLAEQGVRVRFIGRKIQLRLIVLGSLDHRVHHVRLPFLLDLRAHEVPHFFGPFIGHAARHNRCPPWRQLVEHTHVEIAIQR